MTDYVDPKSLGLHPRLLVAEIDKNTLAIVINRKSRIIMADGKKILANITKIKKAKPGKKVIVKTTAPVCSKTLQYLGDQGIEVIRDS
ncbi:MAG: hypothetical protein JSW69_04995 [Deltaproteobacteria bacterium]|jgi:hypothetical protein|nr:MAG: hypothetical protein JSW69_04995 [Deltaproteobacteria bacterium]